MKSVCFDLETSSLYANSGIILCASFKEYGVKGVKTVRADQFKSWKTGKSDNKEMTQAICDHLTGDVMVKGGFDIFIAHNGNYFDKTFINSSCLKYNIPPSLRFEKFIDPVLIARRHMRMARNSLAAILDYFDIEDQKTSIRFKYWMEASLDSNTKALDYIVEHCERDVVLLERAYDKTRKLVKSVDDGGSSR